MMIILVPFVNWVRTGSDKILFFVSTTKFFGVLWNIEIDGEKGFSKINLSKIENTV